MLRISPLDFPHNLVKSALAGGSAHGIPCQHNGDHVIRQQQCGGTSNGPGRADHRQALRRDRPVQASHRIQQRRSHHRNRVGIAGRGRGQSLAFERQSAVREHGGEAAEADQQRMSGCSSFGGALDQFERFGGGHVHQFFSA